MIILHAVKQRKYTNYQGLALIIRLTKSSDLVAILEEAE